MAYTRVIRGEINRSESLSQVSMAADLTFRCMLMVADDYGRLDGRLPILLADLFPLRQNVGPEELEVWLYELAENGCILLYEVGGRPYIYLTGWEKHRTSRKRAQCSKYPEPPPTNLPDIRDDSRISKIVVQGGNGVRGNGVRVYGVHPGSVPDGSDASRPPASDHDPSEALEDLEPARASPPRKTSMPDPFPSEPDLAAWIAAATDLPACARGSPQRAAAWAVARVREWHEAEGSEAACRKRTLRGWVMTVQNAVRKGWALEGFEAAENARVRAEVERVEAESARRAESKRRPASSADAAGYEDFFA